MTLWLCKQPFLCFILVAGVLLLGEVYNVTGVKAQIRFYFNVADKDDALLFESHQPNLYDYSQIISKVKYICATGWWMAYGDINYRSQFNAYGSISDSEFGCENISGTIRSFRYWGSNETTRNGISLYADKFYNGNEILVEGRAYTGISTPILSLAATGTGYSEWRLFEGKYLEGKSVCIQVPKYGYNYNWYWDVPLNLNLNTIGSVFNGCNIQEIEEYKKTNNI